MPRNRTTDDADHIPQDPVAQKPSKKPLPKPGPIPSFTPLAINEMSYGHGQPPFGIQSPYQLFSIFFDIATLELLAKHTNLYAEKCEKSEKPHARTWTPTTAKELRAYIATYIYMGCEGSKAIKDLWNTDATLAGVHDAVRSYISLIRWQQINRFFHISEPKDGKESIFEKVEPLNDILRHKFKKYWKTGTHLAVDKAI